MPQLPKLPRGFADRGPADLAATSRITSTIRRVYELHGFEALETPAIEYTDALGKFLPDQDRPNEGVFSFQDDDEQWLSLRYDLTAPLARYVAANFDALPKPYRSYRHGYVYRNEKPGPGRFRQFMQFDADTVGSASPAADAEMCMMAADTMDALGVPRDDYRVKVNSRRALDTVLASLSLSPTAALTVLRAVDKLDRLGVDGVAALLGEGRKDESGDFTRGAGLPPAAIDQVLRFVTTGLMTPDLDAILSLTDDRVILAPDVVRGLEYYTGAVFEIELSGWSGSVGGGGRYDGLVSRFRDQPVPATGFSIGVSRLQAALAAAPSRAAGPVVVTVFDQDRIAEYQAMVFALHAAGIAAELYLGSGRFGAQMKYADKRNSPCVVIQGSEERASGVILVKDLRRGASLASDDSDRSEHLAAQANAQRSVPVGAMVATVREMLAQTVGLPG
jgi:histidyl-tRNA synthetase